jgi:hypothetical protein
MEKNGERSANRASTISTRPATTMPNIDQRSASMSPASDLYTIQTRNADDAIGRTPRVMAFQAPLATRRR